MALLNPVSRLRQVNCVQAEGDPIQKQRAYWEDSWEKPF